MTANPVPPGYHTVTPYLMVSDASALIEFAQRAFEAEARMKHTDAHGRVSHAEITIGDSVIMLGEGNAEYPPAPASLHLYIADVDAVYARALQAGGSSVREPRTEFYGDRMAGIRDSEGNTWWIATRVENLTPEEMQARAAQQT